MTEKPAIHKKAHFKVVEISTVTDETIQDALNRWTEKGWHFDQIQFVVRESSRRPSMAFLFFLQPALEDEAVRFDIHKQDMCRDNEPSTLDGENGDCNEIDLS
jgi:hypothetical protein